MSKKAKNKAKTKAKKAAKAAKAAAHGKKTLKKTSKPKPKASTKGKTSMAGKKDDDDKKAATTNEHPALKPDGTPYEDGVDPMAPPPDGPLSPSEEAKTKEPDLSGSPGSAGESVPVGPDPRAYREPKDTK